MRKSLLGLLLAIVLCFGSVQEVKAFGSGVDLLENCENSDHPQGIGCILYIKGLLDGFTMGERQRFISPTTFFRKEGKLYEFISELCYPKGFSLIQARLIVIKHLKNHPEKLHEHPSNFVVNSIKEAFPCKN